MAGWGYDYGYDAYGGGGGYGDPYGAGYGYGDPYAGYGDPYGGYGGGDPYGGGGYGGGYGGGIPEYPIYDDYYYPLEYYDELAGYGYNGPWPQEYYEPRPQAHSCGGGCGGGGGCGSGCGCGGGGGGCCCDDEPDHCGCSKPRRRFDDCNGIGDLLERFERDLDTKLGGSRRGGGEGGLVGQWQRILDKFPDKKARIVEIDDEEALDRRARLQKKRAAEARRDRLLEAIAFNGDSPVPGKSNTSPGNQVVHIDFGGGNRQTPGGAPVPGGPPAGYPPAGYPPAGYPPAGYPRPIQGPNLARAYSHPTQPVGYPGQAPQVLYQ